MTLHPIARWLLSTGIAEPGDAQRRVPLEEGVPPSAVPQRVLSGAALLEGLAQRLVAHGMPIMRGSLSLPTLHPEVSVQSATWQRGRGVETSLRSRTAIAQLGYVESPVALIHRGSGNIRCRLVGPDSDLRYPIVREIQAAGGTDYIALSVPLSDGRTTFLSWATDEPGGFSDEQLTLLNELVPFVAQRLEVASLHFTMQSLLEVYLGQNAARRVLAGDVARGAGQRLFAVIWTCDLRDFTALTDSLPADAIVRALDAYFDCVGTPIHALGGEVLKFIGDAVLAIFAVDGEPLAAVCQRAEQAALRALAGMEALSAERSAQGLPPLRIGVALHVGEVLYGNIGAGGRLDFTVIGAAVNEAVRMEALCKSLGTDLIFGAPFVAARGREGLTSLGVHTLRGAKEPHELFTLPSRRFA